MSEFVDLLRPTPALELAQKQVPSFLGFSSNVVHRLTPLLRPISFRDGASKKVLAKKNVISELPVPRCPDFLRRYEQGLITVRG